MCFVDYVARVPAEPGFLDYADVECQGLIVDRAFEGKQDFLPHIGIDKDR